MKFLNISIYNHFSEEEAIKKLESKGYQFLYSTINPQEDFFSLFVTYQEDYATLNFPFIQQIQVCSYEGIDWEEQWKLNCKGYENNKVTIDLSEYVPLTSKKEIKLQAGPGFGDLSHPTTRMMIKMLVQICKGQTFIDVGCGSGILSFAAYSLGASNILGYDIDPDAVLHAKKNIPLNPNSEKIIFTSFDEITHSLKTFNSLLIGLNMVENEQEQAWNEISPFLPTHYEILTSGIIEDRKNQYLSKMQARGWHLVNELSEDGWLCFHFNFK